jgi:type IV pilus assembly protein PilO
VASLGLNKLTSTAKFAVISGVLVLGAAAYYFLFFDDLSQAIDRAKVREKSLHADLATARQNEFAYQRDLAELTERQQRQNQLAKVLPNSTEYPAFLSSLQSVSNVSGITLSAWAPQPEVAEKYYARVPMRLDVEGRFHQIAKFFYGVGQLDRIINMENITMADPKEVDKDYVVKVTALATAFRALSASESVASDKRPPGGKP